MQKGDVIVIRYEGPKGGPGMPEMLTPTSAVMGAGLGKDVALITDGRFSGGSHGFIVGHITPEAQEGGPIALVRTGDRITIDAEKNLLTVDLSDDELSRRRQSWQMPPYKATRGTLAKYIRAGAERQPGVRHRRVATPRDLEHRAAWGLPAALLHCFSLSFAKRVWIPNAVFASTRSSNACRSRQYHS